MCNFSLHTRKGFLNSQKRSLGRQHDGEVLNPDEAMISREEMEKINNAIQQLPPKCKHVFFLAKIEGLPYKDIAALLDISVKTINNHIAFALEEIAKKLNIRF